MSAIIIPNRTFLVRFDGKSGEFGRAMVRILARRSRAKIPMARPNEPDIPPKRTKKVRLGIYRTQIQNLAKNLRTPTLLFQSECFSTRRQTSHSWRARSRLVSAPYRTGKHWLKVAGDTLGSSLCIYLKRMHEVQRLTSTTLRDIYDWTKI